MKFQTKKYIDEIVPQMNKLGFDSNENMQKGLLIAFGVKITIFIGLLLLTYFIFERIIEESLRAWFILSYLINNSYSTWFFVTFCMVLFAIYRRFEIINKCLK